MYLWRQCQCHCDINVNIDVEPIDLTDSVSLTVLDTEQVTPQTGAAIRLALVQRLPFPSMPCLVLQTHARLSCSSSDV